MHVVLVHVHVKPGTAEAFVEASRTNAAASLREPGVARFDVLRQAEDPDRFVLAEVYRTPEAALAHKETAHYLAWRDAVAPMMAEPRTGVKYRGLFPGEGGWDSPGATAG